MQIIMLPTDLKLGPFKVDHLGLLSPASPESFPRFHVRWRGRVLSTEMHKSNLESSQSGELDLTIRPGRLPSSIDTNVTQREAAIALAQFLPKLMPTHWNWHLRADHSILLKANMQITLPVSAVGLVSELSLFLLELDPFLTELDSKGMTPNSPIN